MTFPEALKKLAEKWPEKFGQDAAPGCLCVYRVHPPESEKIRHYLYHFTQDDIDEILALIGWEYDVRRMGEDGEWGGICTLANKEAPPDRIDTKRIYPTKLLAAQAALIAVVERETK